MGITETIDTNHLLHTNSLIYANDISILEYMIGDILIKFAKSRLYK